MSLLLLLFIISIIVIIIIIGCIIINTIIVITVATYLSHDYHSTFANIITIIITIIIVILIRTIIITITMYHKSLHAQTRPPSLFLFWPQRSHASRSVRGEAATPTCGSAGPNLFLSERARHSYDVEEDEEEVEEVDASASVVENEAAVKLVPHCARTGAQSGGGPGSDFKHVVHCQPQKVRLESSGLMKWSLEERPGFQTEWAFVPFWQGAGSGEALGALTRACSSLSSTLRESRDLL